MLSHSTTKWKIEQTRHSLLSFYLLRSWINLNYGCSHWEIRYKLSFHELISGKNWPIFHSERVLIEITNEFVQKFHLQRDHCSFSEEFNVYSFSAWIFSYIDIWFQSLLKIKKKVFHQAKNHFLLCAILVLLWREFVALRRILVFLCVLFFPLVNWISSSIGLTARSANKTHNQWNLPIKYSDSFSSCLLSSIFSWSNFTHQLIMVISK